MALLRPILRCSLYSSRILSLKDVHFSKVLRHSSSAMSCLNANRRLTSPLAQKRCTYRFLSDDNAKPDFKMPKEQVANDRGKHAEGETNAEPEKLTQVQRLKKVFAEYGTTAVVFHVSISLTSLGICYAAVKSGLDIQLMLQKIGLSKGIADSAVTSGASTFVIAYACHKVFAPLRMFLTITCTPLIVRRLRLMGILKTPLKHNS